MALEAADVARFAEVVERVEGIAEKMSPNSTITGTNTIQVNAGGVALWISVMCCVLALACSGFLAVLYLDQKDEIRALRDTDNAIRAYINTGRLSPALNAKPPEETK